MATKARLHWFWRGTLASLFGAACYVGLMYLYELTGEPLASLRLAWHVTMPPVSVAYNLFLIVSGLPPSLGALLTYGLLTRWFGNPAIDGQLHCRRCNHILRGLSEPRCPECGEATCA